MDFVLLLLGFVLLVKCADFFVDGCSNVAKSLGVPSLIIGLTIVSFGTSAPEAAVSLTASIKGFNTICLGNVVGSNICNILLILGVSGMFGTLKAKRKIITRDFVYCIFSGLVLFILTIGFFLSGEAEGIITRTNGWILLCFFAIYLYALLIEAIRSAREQEEKTKFNIKDIFLIIIGIIGIIQGGQLVVNSATNIAKIFDISESVIALTIVAVGTSLPELVTSVVAAKKGQTDIAIGNVVGSNIFNIFFILGLSSAISPVTFSLDSFLDIVFMLISSVCVYLLLLRNQSIGKKSGLILFITYILFMTFIIFR